MMGEKRILVVDDSRLSLQLMSALLQDLRGDVEVETLNNPEAAIERAKQGDISLLMLDLNMPEISGEDVATRLREAGIKLPICFVTANVQSAVKQRLEEHFGPVFHKPVSEALAKSALAYLDRAGSC